MSADAAAQPSGARICERCDALARLNIAAGTRLHALIKSVSIDVTPQGE